jgi:hypothetical protein
MLGRCTNGGTNHKNLKNLVQQLLRNISYLGSSSLSTNLGVGSSNLPRCANKINNLRS